jgi:hypothetical protein
MGQKLERFTCSTEGLLYSGAAFIGFITKTKHGEKYLSVRDGYCLGSQALQELKDLLDGYEGE